MSDDVLKLVDLSRLNLLIKRNIESCEEGRDKNLALLFGVSRAGKSTTFCFLVGRKVIKTEIEVVNPRYPDLRNLQTVYEAFLQPGEVSPIGHGFNAKTEVMGFHEFGNKMLVDTAGLFEPKGAIEEIANMVAIQKIFQICKSVVPILLINIEELSGTASLVKMLMNLTSKLFPDERVVDNSLMVIFTHTQNLSRDSIMNKLIQLQNADNRLSVLTKISDWFYLKNDRVMNLADPVTDNPDTYWRTIKSLQPVTGIHEFALEENSKNKFMILMEEFKTSLHAWIAERNFTEIIKIIETLSSLNDYIPSLVSNTLDYYLQHVTQTLQTEHSNIVRQVELFLESKQIDDQHIKEISNFRELVNKSKNFQEMQRSDALDSLKEFDEWFRASVAKFAEEVNFYMENGNWNFCKLHFEVLFKLSEHIQDLGFQNILSNCVSLVISYIQKELLTISVDDYSFYFDKNNLIKFGNVLSNFTQIGDCLSSFLSEKFSCEVKLREIRITYNRTITTLFDKYNKLIATPDTEVIKDTQTISEILVISKNISDCKEIHSYLGGEEQEVDQCSQLFHRVTETLQKKVDCLLSVLEIPGSNPNSKNLLLSCHFLLQFEAKTDSLRRFYGVIESTKTTAQTYFKELKRILDKWADLDEEQVGRVEKYFKRLKNWKWIDPITTNFGSNKLKKAEKRISLCITSIESALESHWIRKQYDLFNKPFQILLFFSKKKIYDIVDRNFDTISNKYGKEVVHYCDDVKINCGKNDIIGQPEFADQYLKELEGFANLEALDVIKQVNEAKNAIERKYDTLFTIKKNQIAEFHSIQFDSNSDSLNQQLVILDWALQCSELPNLGLITTKFYAETKKEVWNFLSSLIENFNHEIISTRLVESNNTLKKIKPYSKFSRHFPSIIEEIRKCSTQFLSASVGIDGVIKESLWNCLAIKRSLDQLINSDMYESSSKYIVDAFGVVIESFVDFINAFDIQTSNTDTLMNQLNIYRDVKKYLPEIFKNDFSSYNQQLKEEFWGWFDRENKVIEKHYSNSRFNLAMQLKIQFSTLYVKINKIIPLGEDYDQKHQKLDKLQEELIPSTVTKIEKLLEDEDYREVSKILNNSKLSLQKTVGLVEDEDISGVVRDTILSHFSKFFCTLKNLDEDQTISKAEQQIKALKTNLSSEQEIYQIIATLQETTEEELKDIASKNKRKFELLLLETDDPAQVPKLKLEFNNLNLNDPDSTCKRRTQIQEKFAEIVKHIQTLVNQQNFSFKSQFYLAIVFRENFKEILYNNRFFSELISDLTKRYIEFSRAIINCLQQHKLELLSSLVENFSTLSQFPLGINDDIQNSILEELNQYATTLSKTFDIAIGNNDVSGLSQITHRIHQFSNTVFKLNGIESAEMTIQFLQTNTFTEKIVQFVDELFRNTEQYLKEDKFDEITKKLNALEKVHMLEKWVPTCITKREEVIESIKRILTLKAEDCITEWKTVPKNLNSLSLKLKVFSKGESILRALQIVLPVNPLEVINVEVQEELNRLSNNYDLSTAASSLVNLRRLCEMITILEPLIMPALKKYTEQLSSNGRILQLHRELDRLNLPQDKLIVSYIISEFPAFKAFVNKLIVNKTKHFGIEYALQHMNESKADGRNPTRITHASLDKLRALYTEFDVYYKQLLASNLTSNSLQNLINRVKEIATSEARVRRELPELLANMFSYWTLTKSDLKLVMESKDDEYFMKPHPVQVLSIFRILSAEFSNMPIENHLAEIKTGEGKSITLGICAIIFAMVGYNVDVVSYSNILSKRDREEFSDLFVKFGVQNKIKYGTIESLCEEYINRDAPVRDLVSDFIHNKAKNYNNSVQPPRVILIDEVDVFFSPTFLGETYNPLSILVDDRCYQVLNYIWQNHNRPNFTINTITQLNFYQSLIAEYANMNIMFAFQLEQMIADVKNFDDPNLPYKLDKVNGRIGYILHDEISYQISHGHKTTFAYFSAKDKGEITEEVLKSRVGFYLYCGRFSYAEIPKSYVYILGVTGTLQSLAPSELDIIRQFKINKFSYMPSMYGQSDLDFKPLSDVFVLSDLDQYYKKIRDMALEYARKGNAVIIFFSESTRIDSFQKSSYNVPEWNILIEDSEDKPNLFRRATCSGECTLSSKSFGRGTDFVCRDQQVINAGGVVVIQTFFSTNPSESIQIKGRTARQGAKGIFRVVLLETDLLTFFPDEKTVKVEIQSRDLFEKLQSIRDKNYEISVLELKDKVNAAREINQVSHSLRSSLFAKAQKNVIWDYLAQINHSFFSTAMASNYYIVMCLDYSGSMSGSPWTHLLQAVDAFSADRLTKCQQTGRLCNDLLSVVCYNHKACRIISDIPLQNKISDKISVRPSGQTSFAAGIAMSISIFESTEMGGRTPVFLFMSDGECYDGDNEMITMNQKFSASGMKVFVVGFGKDADEERLRRLADLCSGYYYFGATGDLLKHEFERIAYTLSSPVLHH